MSDQEVTDVDVGSAYGGVIFEEETQWDEEAVYAICWARITMSDKEWAEAFHDWDVTREEAATRIEERDYSHPYGGDYEEDADEDDEEA
jgi:hypothetical protein